ncbi:glutathione S-transferase [Rhizobium pisi]|jgi:glutathione S-transferase|uniref:Glutathione S-transferase n=1 Tax=Rhizobium pisi TaxID=574561 RepID=A0A3R9HLK3_9HYPH|nr:glutathione S-transferase family protein [Rhizobium pisi]MBB3133170.1 glutathione S-transferase [Rhizobium pisi]RSB85847.1 glutathione S-transferase family protein [Rhizobium pisi]TCA61790.1 glutathione S-transferase family protein [Rhizobium pisi]
MLTLYDYRPSQNGWKVRVLFGLLDIPYQVRLLSIFEGEARTDAFFALNPAGGIPVLELEDGRTIAESNSILAYLAEGTRFLPADRYQRAKVMQWLFFEQYHIEPVIGTLRFWTLTGRLGLNAAMVEAKRAAGLRALAALERGLKNTPYLVDEEFSIADLAVYAYAHRAADCGFVLTDYPAVTTWFDRVREVIGPGHPVYPYSDDPHSAI